MPKFCNKRSTFIITLVCVLLIISCKYNPNKSFPDIFVGKWNLDYPDASGYDVWTKINDTLLNGKGYADSTTLFEDMLLHKNNGQWSMVIKGYTEGNSDVVKFDLVEQSKNSFTFENKHHDFPQQIIYKFRSEKSLVVVLKNETKWHEIFFVLDN